MGVGNEFFFEDGYGNIRVDFNDELVNIITKDTKEANEFMLVLITELLREINELADKLLTYHLDEETYALVQLCKKNHTMYIINQERILQRIAELEGGN